MGGSAWWISRKAMKFWFDEEDNLIQPPYSSEKIAEAIKSYFGIKDRFGLLTYCYDKFEKPHFAGVCKNIAQQAEMGDPLSKHVFNEAGKALAMHITALSRKMESSQEFFVCCLHWIGLEILESYERRICQ